MIDLRSDTVTRPGAAMRAAMAEAEVGDDVFGDDPTVNRLEAVLAERFGFEAGLFLPTGTQSNLVGLMTHCQRGDEYIVGQDAHTYKYEGGGAAVLGSIQPQPLNNLPDGSLDLTEVARAIKPDDAHYARTRLLAIENTISGKVLPVEYHRRAVALCREKGLALHLDGARIYNACVKLGTEPAALCEGFDSVSICLSKGLGAPAGAVLVGPRDYVRAARRWRKMVGGGMRQAGILAAAGLHAIDRHVARLADDHANAARLGEGLARVPGLHVAPVQTNMVFVQVPQDRIAGLGEHLKAAGVLAFAGPSMRLVTHLDVSTADIDTVVAAFDRWFDDARASTTAVAQ